MCKGNRSTKQCRLRVRKKQGTGVVPMTMAMASGSHARSLKGLEGRQKTTVRNRFRILSARLCCVPGCFCFSCPCEFKGEKGKMAVMRDGGRGENK